SLVGHRVLTRLEDCHSGRGVRKRLSNLDLLPLALACHDLAAQRKPRTIVTFDRKGRLGCQYWYVFDAVQRDRITNRAWKPSWVVVLQPEHRFDSQTPWDRSDGRALSEGVSAGEDIKAVLKLHSSAERPALRPPGNLD